MKEPELIKRLKGRVAIVVGAGSRGPGWGNGKATAALLAREGANVVCVDINLDAARETCDLIIGEGGQATAVCLDAADEASVRGLVSETVEKYGAVHILINNVGISINKSITDLSVDDWDKVFDVNLKSCFLAMKHTIPAMKRNGGGVIINISSSASIRYTGTPYPAYYATKAAMNHLTETTAVTYAPDKVRINAILPGLIKTPMVEVPASQKLSAEDYEKFMAARDAQIPMGYQGDAWDVAEAALYLVSDSARYVTGAMLVVDGGFTINAPSRAARK